MRVGPAGLTRGPATSTAVNLIVRKMDRRGLEMKLEIEVGKPKFTQIQAQYLNIGEVVVYRAGNGVLRISRNDVLSFGADGNFTILPRGHVSIGHGYGDLLPPGSTLKIVL